jgi:DNA polymerase III sliding clamp (beta) subunit (PCNA family)
MLLNKHNLSIVSCASKDETRYGLCGVRVTKDYTEATDGHRLARVTVPTADPAEFPDVGITANGEMPSVTVPSEAAKALEKALPRPGRSRRPPILENAIVDTEAAARGTFRAIATDLTTRTPVEAQVIDARYPDSSQVFPSGKPLVAVGLNGLYLAECAKLAAGMTNGRSHGIKLSIYDKEGLVPIKLEATNPDTGQTATFIIIMPMRL